MIQNCLLSSYGCYGSCDSSAVTTWVFKGTGVKRKENSLQNCLLYRSVEGMDLTLSGS